MVRMRAQPVAQRLFADGDGRPWDHLTFAVLAQHTGVDQFRVHVQHVRQRTPQPGGIDRGAGGKNAVRRPVQRELQVLRDDVGRVGKVDDDPAEPGCADSGGDGVHDLDGGAQHIHPGLAFGRIRQRTGGNQHQLRVARIGIVARADFGARRQIRHGVGQIERLRFGFSAVGVDEYQRFRQPLRDQRIPCLRADAPGADNDDFSIENFHIQNDPFPCGVRIIRSFR